MKSPSPQRAAPYNNPSYREILGRVAGNMLRLRTERGWTQLQAAVRCGLATPVYQIVETGRRNLTTTTLSCLCEGFGIDPAELLRPTTAPVKRSRGRPKKAASNAAVEVPQSPQATATESPTRYPPNSPTQKPPGG